MHNGGLPEPLSHIADRFRSMTAQCRFWYRQLCACRLCRRPPTPGPGSSCMHAQCYSGRQGSAVCTVGTAQRELPPLRSNTGP